jgi:hypothetical protein
MDAGSHMTIYLGKYNEDRKPSCLVIILKDKLNKHVMSRIGENYTESVISYTELKRVHDEVNENDYPINMTDLMLGYKNNLIPDCKGKYEEHRSHKNGK